jgi:hypothetical protein
MSCAQMIQVTSAGHFFGDAGGSRSREAISRRKDDETILPANEVISSACENDLKRTPVIYEVRPFRFWTFRTRRLP